MIESVWTDERTELLRQLWSDGLSCSQIAAQIGNGVSRNAVISKVHRLGLFGRKKPISQREKTKRVIIRPRRKKVFGGEIQIVSDQPLPQELSAVDIPIEQRKTLLELTNESCRWPYGNPGDAEFFFCGAEDADFAARRPYCHFHAGAACPRTRAPALVPGRMAA